MFNIKVPKSSSQFVSAKLILHLLEEGIIGTNANFTHYQGSFYSTHDTHKKV